MKKEFKVPVTWEVCGFCYVEAESLEEALTKFDEDPDVIPLPYDSDYIDGSFHREEDTETIESYNNKNS